MTETIGASPRLVETRLERGIRGAGSQDQLLDARKAAYRAHTAGVIGDAPLARLDALGREKYDELKARPRPGEMAGRGSRPPALVGELVARAAPRSPDREASRIRRRKWGGDGRIPPQMRWRYTEGERAALSVIADHIVRHRVCDLCIDAIAAKAGVCRTTAQNAIRAAKRLRHLQVTERRRRGMKSLTNLIEICDGAWATWLKIAGDAPAGRGGHGKGRTGFKTPNGSGTTESDIYEKRRKPAAPAAAAPPKRRRKG